MRCSPALKIVEYLSRQHVKIKAYDPAAMENAKKSYFHDMDIYYAKDPYDALDRADAVVIITEWDAFKQLDLSMVKSQMAGNIFIDLRNLYERAAIEESGFTYYCVGR